MDNNSYYTLRDTILSYIKNNRKVYLARVIMGIPRAWLSCTWYSNTGWQAEIRRIYLRKNPNIGGRLLAIGRALQEETIFRKYDQNKEFEAIHKMLLRLHKKYGARIDKLWKNKKNEIASMPRHITLYPTHSECIFELLKRDFIHNNDFKFPKNGEGYVLRCNEYNLIWPQLLDDRDKALEIKSRVNINNLITIKKWSDYVCNHN